MAYSVRFEQPDGGEQEFFLCSVGAWTQVIEWYEGLSVVRSQHPERQAKITSLIEDGQVTGTDTLMWAIYDLLGYNDPPVGVRRTLNALRSHIGSTGSPTETVSIVE